jgi:cytochrome P450
MQTNTKTATDMSRLPGPGGIPLLGNLLQVTPEILHRDIEKWSDQYGSIFKIKFANIPAVVITDPETIQYVLKNRPEKFRRLHKMDNVIREMGIHGVFNAEGEDWKRQRQMVTQALNMSHIINFFPLLTHIIEKLLARWNHLSAENSSIDIKVQLMRYTVDVTSRLAFGYNMNTIEQTKDAIQDHLEIIFPAIFKRVNAPVPYWRFVTLPADKRLAKSLQVIYDTMQGVINETKQKLKENPELQSHPTNFLEALIAASARENPISNELIIGNVLTILLAGEDTTAHTLSWVFYFMHLHPEVQKKMQEEADIVLGEDAVLRNYDDNVKLVYIEAVVYEAMRLKPVAPVFFMNSLEDTVLENVSIPKETFIILQTQYSAINKKYFSNPEKFIPERWIAGVCPMHDVHNERAFVPFGAGPRFCPGYNLAMLEMKAVLAMACKNFHVSMETNPAEVREVLAFAMMPSNFNVKLVKRAV